MINAIILGEGPSVVMTLQAYAVESENIEVVRVIERFPKNAYEVARLMSSFDPELILVHVPDSERNSEILSALRLSAARATVIAFGKELRFHRRECERLGIIAVCSFPPTYATFEQALQDAGLHSESPP